ncbi:C4-dicarboxylate TRAP transporter large permease protein DctM [subsurface metagenome]
MINIDPTLVGVLGFIIFLALLLGTGLPIGIGMAVVGFFGIWVMKGGPVALQAVYQLPYTCIASWLLSVIPMFIFMGYIAFYAGFTRDAYDAAYKWVGRLPGGLAISTLMGGAAFGACCGSSVAATAALGKIALPEMEGYHYDRRLAAGTVAMGGTLAALIPPSILLVLYGVVVEQSIGELLIAGILPGLLSMFCFIILVVVRVRLRPQLAPRGEKFSWKEKLLSLKGVIGIAIIFLAVIGGIYTGIFTPTEAGALGAFTCLILSLIMRRMNWVRFKETLHESLRVYSSIFLIILGAYMFIRFLALTRLPIDFAEFITSLPVHPMTVLAGIILVYLILGCFMDAIGLLLLTVPFIFPTVLALGFDLIWFGVIVVKMLEIALLTPPVGIQAYVLKSVAPHLSLGDIFMGFLPFFLVDVILVVGLLVAFPQISLLLPGMMW